MTAEAAIRRAMMSDRDVVGEIAVEAWRPIYAHYRELLGDDLFVDLHSDWEESKRRQVQQACQHDTPGVALVATLDGVVVGFVSFYLHAAPVGIVGNNAVHPRYQRRGIAGQLYEAALAELRAAGMRYARVTTGTDPAHAPARRAYEKAGFSAGPGSVTYYQNL
jgi:ribosomal protein S18 acetylase RimI-like enzyme